MRIFITIIYFLKFCEFFVYANNDNYENVICGASISLLDDFDEENYENFCMFNEMRSNQDIEAIFAKLRSGYQFYYQQCININYHSQRCETKREKWDFYPNIIIHGTNLTRLVFNEYSHMEKKKTVIFSNVGLKELNREDLKPFKSVELLDISSNNLTYLGNMVFRFVQELKTLKLSANEIESIHIGAFDECSPLLQDIDLSYNKLKEFPVNILDSITTKSLSLHLNFNQIEKISTPMINKIISLDVLDISNNLLKNFTLECDQINVLWLNDNKLEDFSTPNCTISHLYLSNNELSELNVEKVSSLFLSQNIRLKKLTISDLSELSVLEARDLNANLITIEMLKNATKMENLDLSGTFIGPLAYDTFADMTFLESLKLKNTGISRIDYGMLSHQKQLTVLDISYNNFGSIDLHVLTNLKNLENLDISGNNLTQIAYFDSLTRIFPNLKFIGIDQNDFNCTYLAMIVKSLNEKDILITEPENKIKSTTNINGIGCTPLSQIKVKPLESVQDAISNKLNEIIEQINTEKANNENEKIDADVMRSQMFHIRNEMLEIKTRIVKNQINANMTPANGSIDMSEIRRLVESINNFTLEKQKLASDQLLVRINELQLEIAKQKMENERNMHKNEILTAKNAENSNGHARSDEGGHKVTEVLLIIIITSLVVAAIAFIYVKFKDFYRTYRAYNQTLMGVRARSTNTINTTVEMPFDDRQHTNI